MGEVEKRVAELEQRVAVIEQKAPESPDDMLTTSQVGRIIGKSKTAVRLLIESGKIEGIREGFSGAYRVQRSEVTAYRERLRAKVLRRNQAAR